MINKKIIVFYNIIKVLKTNLAKLQKLQILHRNIKLNKRLYQFEKSDWWNKKPI